MHRNQLGLTLVELILVIVVVGIVAAVALPRFMAFSEDAHSVMTRSVSEEFRAGINMLNYKWLSQGDTGLVSPLSLNSEGFPSNGTSPFTTPTCTDLWNQVLTHNLPLSSVLTIGAEGWWPVGVGSFCFYLYQTDTSPLRFIRYNANTGEVVYFPS